jgi:hypothetical protein
MALTKIQAESMNLADTYAFSGTVTGAGLASPFPTGTAVTSEGGAVTTNIAQGLAKAWISFNGGVATPVAIDSFGTSTLTDNATGDYSQTLTSAMGNANYVHTGSAGVNDGSGNAGSLRSYGYNTARTQSTTVYNMNNTYGNNNAINAYVVSMVHGDLA